MSFIFQMEFSNELKEKLKHIEIILYEFILALLDHGSSWLMAHVFTFTQCLTECYSLRYTNT